MYDPKTAKAENNQRSLLKIVDGGHALADHSFDHMSHNSKDSPQNAYTNVEQDMVKCFRGINKPRGQLREEGGGSHMTILLHKPFFVSSTATSYQTIRKQTLEYVYSRTLHISRMNSPAGILKLANLLAGVIILVSRGFFQKNHYQITAV